MPNVIKFESWDEQDIRLIVEDEINDTDFSNAIDDQLEEWDIADRVSDAIVDIDFQSHATLTDWDALVADHVDLEVLANNVRRELDYSDIADEINVLNYFAEKDEVEDLERQISELNQENQELLVKINDLSIELTKTQLAQLNATGVINIVADYQNYNRWYKRVGRWFKREYDKLFNTEK